MVAKETIEHNDVRDLTASMKASVFACYSWQQITINIVKHAIKKNSTNVDTCEDHIPYKLEHL